jgi:hypothetical protein
MIRIFDEIARAQVLRVAFEEDVICAMLGRWVSELEPQFVRNGRNGQVIGLTYAGDWTGQHRPIVVRFEDLTIEEIREHYERRRRRSKTHLQLVETGR